MNLKTKNTSASGLIFNNYVDLIGEISKIKANQHGTISYFGPDDIEQESMIKLWKAIPKYNEKCGTKLRVFLSICAENRIIDIRRGLVYRHNKPCFRCPFWNEAAAASGIHDCLVTLDKMNCKRFCKHEKNLHLKMSVNSPDNIDNTDVFDDMFCNSVESVDLEDFIYTKLDKCWHPIYDKFKESHYSFKSLTVGERNLLKEKLESILAEYRSLL